MKNHTKNLIHYNGYVMIKDLKYVNISCVNPLYLIINKMTGHFGEINKYKYLKAINESKYIRTKYKELWSKIRLLIRPITENSDGYDKKHMKIKFNSMIICL